MSGSCTSSLSMRRLSEMRKENMNFDEELCAATERKKLDARMRIRQAKKEEPTDIKVKAKQQPKTTSYASSRNNMKLTDFDNEKSS